MNRPPFSTPRERRPDPSTPSSGAEVWTSADMALRSRRFWLIAAVVLFGLGVLCLPIARAAWVYLPEARVAAGPLAAALVWFGLAGLALLVRRSRSLQGGGEPRSIIAAHPDHIVLAGTDRIPYRELTGLRLTWDAAQPRGRAVTPGRKVGDAMINSALEQSGHPGLLRITMDVPAHRVNSSRESRFTMVRVTAATQAVARVEIRCHPLFVSGDMVGVHRVLSDHAQEAGVPALVD